MSEERLKEIKDSIDLQLEACKIFKQDNELTLEELELYNEVVRLREIIKEAKRYINKCQLGVDVNDNPVMLIDQEEGKELLDILEQYNLTLEQLTGVENE